MALPAPAADHTVVVTGASAGIGAALARELAARGHGVTLVARREDRLRELAAELEERDGVRATVVALDLTAEGAPTGLLDAVDAEGRVLGGLCNNAGFAATGPALENEASEEEATVRLNVLAPHALTLAAARAMAARGEGAILNVSSVYAAAPVPYQATYAATKAFLSSFSEALHTELDGTGVSVTTCSPGPVRGTEAFAAAGAEDLAGQPGVVWTDAQDVARTAVRAMELGRRAVTPGLTNRAAELAARRIPRTVLLPLWKGLAGARLQRALGR